MPSGPGQYFVLHNSVAGINCLTLTYEKCTLKTRPNLNHLQLRCFSRDSCSAFCTASSPQILSTTVARSEAKQDSSS